MVEMQKKTQKSLMNRGFSQVVQNRSKYSMKDCSICEFNLFNECTNLKVLAADMAEDDYGHIYCSLFKEV